MNTITEKNSFPSNSILEEVPDKKARKEVFILILEDELRADDEKYLPQWKTLLYVLIEVNTNKDLLDHFLIPSFAECFFDKILTNAVKAILDCEELVSKEFNQVLDAILVQTLLIWSKNLHNCPLTLWAIVYERILEKNNRYYKIKKSMLDLESPLETSSEHLVWLQTLKKGDIIDCVKTARSSERQLSLKVWSHAEIISMTQRSMEVSFIKDSENSQEIDKTASCHEIAPYKTRCDDFDWRMGLQPGDLIDARCEWMTWNNAIIIETRENMQGEKEVLFGFRTYTEDGNKVDSKGRKCFGSLENYDKWVNATSPFIAKKNSMTRISTFDPDGDRLNDSIDRIFKPSSSEKTIYAVYQKDRCKSITFVNIINQFGEHGGFENVSQALLDKINPIPPKNGKKVCETLSKLNEALHRTFVTEYASKLKNFWASRHKYIYILDKFLRRIYPPHKFNEMAIIYGLEHDQMNPILLTNYLEQNGLPQEYLVDSEKRSRLFNYMKDRELTTEQFIRYSKCINPEGAFLSSLVDHIFETNPEELDERSLELIMVIFCNATTVPEGYHEKFFNFLQRSIYINLERFSYDLLVSLNTFFAHYSNDFLSTDEILQILYKITENVAQHTLVLPSLNLIGKFSKYKPKADKTFSQETYIEHLCQEKDLLGLVLQEFRLSKHQLITKTQGQTITTQLIESLLPMSLKYIDDYVSGMADTVTFLHTTCPGNRSKGDILKELWDITFKNGLLHEEKCFMLRKLRDIMISQEGPLMNEDDLKFFINELNYIQSPSDLTLDAYQCYMNLFVTLHEKLGNIYDVVFIASGSGSASEYRYDKFVDENRRRGEDLPEFKARVPVDKLEGFDQIWKFMIFSEDFAASNYAIDFHVMVYSNLENEFRNKGETLWQGFLTTVKRHLTKILENKKITSAALLKERCSRCILSIIRMLERTEKSISGGFQPHWKLNNRGNIRVCCSGINIQMNFEQTVGDLLDEYEKEKGARVGKQVRLRQTGFRDCNKRYLPLFEADVRDNSSISLNKDIPVLGDLLANRREGLDIRAKVIFTKWFDEFSADGSMSPDQFGMFLQSAGRDAAVNSSLVKDTFETYDTDRDGLLTLENFLAYYQVTCDRHRLEVWRDIVTRGEMYGSKLYDFDEFGEVKEAGEPESEITPSLRSQMALDNELHELLYSLLKLECDNTYWSVHWVYWLLQRLPTNLKVFEDIVTLHGVRDVEEASKRDWEQVFTSESLYTVLYALDIIDHLFISNMEDNIPDEIRENMSGELDIWAQNPELLKYKKTWCQDFVKLGGSKHLSDAIKAVKNHHDDKIKKRMAKTTQRVLTYLCFYTDAPKIGK